MTRIPGTIWTPAEFDPAYPLIGKAFPRTLEDILYTVNHDAQGYEPYLRRGNGMGKLNSWTLTNLTDGTRLQHYELEAGSWTSSSYESNTKGVATEHESQDGDLSLPITEAQVNADLETELFLATVCPNLLPPIKGQGRREHNEFSTSTCPNGRIQPLYDREGDMPLTDEDATKVAKEVMRLLGAQAMEDIVDAQGNTHSPAWAWAQTLAKLDTMPSVHFTEEDFAKMAKANNDDLHRRTKE